MMAKKLYKKKEERAAKVMKKEYYYIFFSKRGRPTSLTIPAWSPTAVLSEPKRA